MSENVGIVIVSHSPDIARGAADMVRQMVGDEVPLAWCGGDPGGGLGTSVPAILKVIQEAWSDRGVAILVDLGGAETNSEMAVETLPEDRHRRVVVFERPHRRGRGGRGYGIIRRREPGRGAANRRSAVAILRPW